MSSARGQALGGAGSPLALRSGLGAITRTSHLMAAHVTHFVAADAGYHQALLVGSILMAAAAVLALRIGNTRKAAPLVMVSTEPAPSRRATVPRRAGRPAQQPLYPDK
jgi:hypothetical protein